MSSASGAGSTKPILLRAPDGADIWTIVELQGSIESKAATLNGALDSLTATTARPAPTCTSYATSSRPDPNVCVCVARLTGVQFAQLSWEPNSVSPAHPMCQHTL